MHEDVGCGRDLWYKNNFPCGSNKTVSDIQANSFLHGKQKLYR
jgi:hypothetical protein